MDPTRFAGRTALVTGAGHGIGRATVQRLAAEGARVGVWDIDAQTAEDTAATIRRAGGDATSWRVDVADPTSVSAGASSVLEAFGRVDLLHNNAGILRAGTVLDHSLEEWDLLFATNVRSMVLVTRAFLPGMLDAGAGAIVNTSSVSGLVGDAGLVGYDTTKGAIIQFTRQLAADWAPRGVRPNCVCPGWVKTGFNDPQFEADPSLDEEVLVRSSVPMQRQASAEEIAAAVCFLLSDDASYIAGQALVVDGGMTAA